MKTTVRQLPYSEVQALPLPPHRAPRKPGIALRTLIYGLSGFALAGTGFRCETNELSKIPKEQSWTCPLSAGFSIPVPTPLCAPATALWGCMAPWST